MIIVIIHLFHREVFFLTNFAIWSLGASCKFKLGANFTIILFWFRNIFKSIAYYVEACIADITINHNIILTIRWTKTYFAICLEFLDCLFRFISLLYIRVLSRYIIKVENSTTFIFMSLDEQFHDSWPIELLFHQFNICFVDYHFYLRYLKQSLQLLYLN